MTKIRRDVMHWPAAWPVWAWAQYSLAAPIRGFGLVINATPIGMKTDNPHPIASTHFIADQFVGCVITVPAVPPMIEVARAKGCNTMTGTDMFTRVCDLMVQFLLEAP